MKKTFRSILAGALALLAVSCYDDSAIRNALASLESRVAELETKLNIEVGTLNSKFDGLEVAYKLADQNLAAELAALRTSVTASLNTLTQRLDALDGALDGYVTLDAYNAGQSDYNAYKETLQQKITELLAADKKLSDDLAAALEALRKADSDLQAADAEILASLVAVGVTNVSKNAAGNVVITFVDKSTIEIPTKSQDGLVTVVEVDGVKYWAVLVNGEKQNLGVKVGHPSIEFEVDPETNELLYSVDGGEFEGTGAYVSNDQEYLLTDFYQGYSGEYDENWEPLLNDYYTFVFGGVEYQLPVYKVDESVVAIKAGKTYFKYGESKTIDVVLNDITSIYVMSKPEGWTAKLNGKKLTVKAPVEANTFAEKDGEVLLHCTTKEGKCKIAKLVVTTGSGYSLSVAEDGTLTIINPEVVTSVNMWGEELTDFNDAYIGLAPVAAFEADPVSYVQNIDNNWDDNWIYLNNWKMNAADYDEDWNIVYTIGGEYKPGEYEVDQITTTVAQFYADMTWGSEIPATPFVVWSCPMNESGLPRIEDLVYAYYLPPFNATITEVSKSTADIEVKVEVSGASSYYVGLVTEDQLYGFPIDQYMQMQEGPFGYFQMALEYGFPDYAFSQMGMRFGETGSEMPETLKASDLMGGSLMPEMKVYMWVFPVVEGLELADYTYEKHMKPYIYDFTTNTLSAGGSATVEFANAELKFTSMSVDMTATEGSSMIYYNWYDVDTYNEATEESLTEELLAEGYVIGGEEGTAVNNGNVAPGSEFYLVALAVDAEGKYGEVVAQKFTAPLITYSTTFTATLGEPTSEVYYSGYKYDFPINVTGGDAAKYYYVLSTTEFTDEQLANLPLTYDYNYNFKSNTNVSAGKLAGQYLNASSTYYLAVVVESTTGELSPVVKMTVEVPASAE